jgi:hypothetical protein
VGDSLYGLQLTKKLTKNKLYFYKTIAKHSLSFKGLLLSPIQNKLNSFLAFTYALQLLQGVDFQRFRLNF